MKTFFLAHRKDAADPELVALSNILVRLLDKIAKGQPYRIVLGRDYFERRFKSCGSWESWAREVATGVEFLSHSPIFNAIFVPARPVGAGTVKIVELAIAGRKPVFAFGDECGATVVAPVARVEWDPSDWQSGGRLFLSRPLAEAK